jgi:hypothetical protein
LPTRRRGRTLDDLDGCIESLDGSGVIAERRVDEERIVVDPSAV